MSHKYKISIHLKDIGEKISASGEFPDNEWEALNKFIQYSEEMFESKFVKAGMQSRLKITGNSEGNVVFESHLPNWNDVIVFLHLLRPIYLQNETTHYYNICNFIGHRIDNEYIRAIISQNRDMYSGKLLRSYFKVSVNDVIINSEDMLSKWLNSYEYHRDEEKREFVVRINEVFPLDASKVIFIQLLAEKVKAIRGLYSLVAVIIGNVDSASGQIRLDDI